MPKCGGGLGRGSTPYNARVIPPCEFVRRLRRQPTDAERLLWSKLRARRLLGLKFCRQVPLGPYVADFVCFERRLVVELDGGQHAEGPQRARDERRTRWLEAQGFRVLRFWDHEVLRETEGVLEQILRACEESPSPQPLPIEGGGGAWCSHRGKASGGREGRSSCLPRSLGGEGGRVPSVQALPPHRRRGGEKPGREAQRRISPSPQSSYEEHYNPLVNHLTDTSPEAQAAQLAALRRLGPAGRARLVAELCRRARALTEEGVRLRHPDWPPYRIRHEAIRLTLGSRLFEEVYGAHTDHDP